MTQDVSSTLVDREPCMCGRATLVMLVSRICMTVMSITEIVMAHLWVDDRVVEGWAGSDTRRIVTGPRRQVNARGCAVGPGAGLGGIGPEGATRAPGGGRSAGSAVSRRRHAAVIEPGVPGDGGGQFG